MRLVHINHGWRGKESDADEAFVRHAARRWGVPISVFRLKPEQGSSRSPEEAAREQRKQIFERLLKRYAQKGDPAWIFTAHHADDLAETLIWRLFTGTIDTHGAGISFRHGQELRPLLRIRKKQLAAFLKEEGEGWREDRTNFEGRLLRSRLRLELMPVVERLFPRAVERVTSFGLDLQRAEPVGAEVSVDPSILFSAAGLKVRRAHWKWLRQKKRSGQGLALPGGWILRNQREGVGERWILEKDEAR